ncbi:transposase [Paenibacillus graminis]|uniref:Transposase n=2 Tax=Paenibacillus graminis TaxID=189425 RepID=A0A089M0L6_9BACL|nr:transposase [Paenibacillus graminis]AIQ67133.1 transposase [Paenibacillus graminis]AIQ68618.1 transposase [Paenibacillus graminis]AIQ68817.1 transposase [Paenibacillus graminis]
MCSVFEVSRSGYYKWRSATSSPQAERKALVLRRIIYHFKDNRQRYGSPKITELLLKEGFTISERTVGKYMRELGLRSCVAKRFRVKTTDSNHNLPIAPNLLNQKFATAEPNKVWVTDITYIPCRQGRLYLASVLDLCTREIVGWRLEERMTTDLVLGALDDAYKAKRPPKGLIHHSDRGSQYASADYRKRLKKYHMKASMSRKGNCYDNACIESFHSVLKKEFVYCTKFKTKQHAQDEMFQYIEFFYNRKRIHSALGYVSPAQFAAKFKKRKTA